jgi:DNA-binding phage protein
MPTNADAIYELWDVRPLVYPQHSFLYHLDPIGIGTPFVESLTSYVIRLADAHSVYPRTLFTNVLFPALKRPYLYSNGRPVYDHLTTFWTQSPNLNGTGILASNLVQVVEHLTVCSCLRFLTMLPWKEVLATRKLFRRTCAWCSACYEEWRATQQPVYEPLLWLLDVIRICPKHKLALQMRCPHPDCARALSPLAPRAQPGYCAWCNRWLGYVSRCEHLGVLDREEMEQQQWVADTVGELLTAAPLLATPLSRDGLIASLNQCVTGAGNMFAATRLLRTNQKSFYRMISGQQIPTLGTLMRMCVHLKIPLLCFLRGDLPPISISPAKAAPNEVVSMPRSCGVTWKQSYKPQNIPLHP